MEGRIKILLIEDNPADALLVQEIIDHERLDFTVAETLEEALEQIRQAPPELILLDLTLPDSDGIESFDTLHTHFPQLPVIVLSGHEDDALALACVQHGAHDYLIKSAFNGEQLRRAILYAASRTHLMQSHQREEALRALSSHIQEAREAERVHIARELHDALGSQLTALKLDIHWLGSRCKPVPEVEQRLHAMKQLADELIQTTRRICTELRPALLEDLGLLAAIEWQTEQFTEHSGLPCSISVTPEAEALCTRCSPAESLTLFRVLQEALTNIARHAQAHAVTVQLQHLSEGLQMVIQDDGCGLNGSPSKTRAHHGINGMRERMTSLGGELTCLSSPGCGTTLQAFLPIPSEL